MVILIIVLVVLAFFFLKWYLSPDDAPEPSFDDVYYMDETVHDFYGVEDPFEWDD